jgi:tetratricopeptide (TPR) repeat protein
VVRQGGWRRWLGLVGAPLQTPAKNPHPTALIVPVAHPSPPATLDGPATAAADEGTDGSLLTRARTLRASGDIQGSQRLLEDALGEAERPALLQLELGETHRALPDLPAAEAAYAVAVVLEPTLGLAWLRLGEIQARYERPEDALASLRLAREHLTEPLRAQALLLLADTLARQFQLTEAREAYLELLGALPDHALATYGLAAIELRTGHESAAVERFEAAFGLEPALREQSNQAVAAAYRQCGRWREALAMFEAEARRRPASPGLRWDTCQTRLALGEWAAGWDDYASRFAARAVPYRPLAFRTWNGEPMPDGTLVVLAEQGLGDEIMFASCMPDALARVGHLIVECEPRLAALYRRSFPQATVLPTRREQDAAWLAQAPREPDRQVFAGDLPRLFRRQRSDFPAHQGYLKADPERTVHWRTKLRAELGDGLHVGISWRGGTERTLQQRRTVPPPAWAPILRTPGCRFVNLQYGLSDTERHDLEAAAGVPVAHYPQAIDDYDETAALVCALDLVVSVCTAIIHLGGALGRPVWILTPKVPEWRYTAHDTSLPWYPSTRLFRQAFAGDWQNVCHEVSVALLHLTQNVTVLSSSDRQG